MRDKKKYHNIILIVAILLLSFNFSLAQKYSYKEEQEFFKKFKFANTYFEEGKNHFLNGNYKKAEKEFKKCVKKMPEYADAYFFLSQIYYKKGNFQQALKYMENAKANFKFMVKIRTDAQRDYILQLQELKENYEHKVSSLRDELAVAKSGCQIAGLQTEIEQIKEKIDTIDAELKKLVPKSVQVPADYFYFHGNIFFKLKNYQEACDQYLKGIKVNPKHSNAYNNLALIYYMTEQYQKAMNYLAQAEANGAQINPELKKAIFKALRKQK